MNRPASRPRGKNSPIFARLLALRGLSQLCNTDQEAIARQFYAEPRAALDLIERTAVAIGDTTTTGWASDLVTTIIAEFVAGLRPLAAFAQLRDLGPRFTLEGSPVRVPVRAPTTTASGAAWVGESGAIPVLQRKVGAGTLNLHKTAGIVPFSNELAHATGGQVERVMQAIVSEDLAELIDSTLADDAPASALRPAGLRNGVTASASVNAETDLAALASAMADAKAIAPALLINPARLASLWAHAAFGVQLVSGRLGPFVAIPSNYIPADVLLAVDGASFASGLGAPDIFASPAATLVMADADAIAPTMAVTAAGAVDTAGEVLPDGGIHIAGPPTGAGTAGMTAQSMLQTNSTALRVVAPVSWAMTRSGAVAAVDGAAW